MAYLVLEVGFRAGLDRYASCDFPELEHACELQARTKHAFWHLTHTGNWNQDVRSLCLRGPLGPRHADGCN